MLQILSLMYYPTLNIYKYITSHLLLKSKKHLTSEWALVNDLFRYLLIFNSTCLRVSARFIIVLRCAQRPVGQGAHLPGIFFYDECLLMWCNFKAFCFGAIPDIMIELRVYLHQGPSKGPHNLTSTGPHLT